MGRLVRPCCRMRFRLRQEKSPRHRKETPLAVLIPETLTGWSLSVWIQGGCYTNRVLYEYCRYKLMYIDTMQMDMDEYNLSLSNTPYEPSNQFISSIFEDFRLLRRL